MEVQDSSPNLTLAHVLVAMQQFYPATSTGKKEWAKDALAIVEKLGLEFDEYVALRHLSWRIGQLQADR